MKHILILSALAVALWGVQPAMAAASDIPTVDQILDKHIEAIGGKAAMQKLTSRTLKASAEMPGMGNVTWEFFAKAPNKLASVVEMPNFGTVREGFDGKVAWSQNAAVGIREKSGDELAKTKRDADFYRSLNFKLIYPDLVCKGIEQEAGEDAYVLESKPSAQSQERLYFSKKSGLLIRQDAQFMTAEGKLQTITHLGDHRVTDGVKMPYDLRIQVIISNQPEMVINMKFSEIRHNVTIEDARFVKPSK